jgi:hypothetical protein
MKTWFQNKASGFAQGDSGGKSKTETRGHPTGKKAWTALSVCGHIYKESIATVQIGLSEDGEKKLSNYRPALGKVFDSLSVEDRQDCERMATEWNKMNVPDDVQRK